MAWGSIIVRTQFQLIAGVLVAGVFVASCAGGSEGGSDDSKPAESSPVSTDSVIQTTGAPETTSTLEPEPRHLSGDSDYLFGQDQLHTIEIDLSEEALAGLDADPTAEEYVEGNLTFEGEEIGPIGVRYKGSVGAFLFCTDGPNPFMPSGAKTCTKLSMKLKINWDDSDAEFYGVKKVQLHSQNLDETMMHERLGYWMFREMGVPAPRSTHARVVVNGEYVGLFALTEQIDGRFNRENFDDGSGNLYKEVWPFDESGNPRSVDELIDGLKTNEDEDPTAQIITEFAEELATAPPEEAVDVIARWTDIDVLLRTFVVDRAIKNDDGALHWYCFEACAPHNFYWYEDPSSQQVFFIPWDLDNSFANLLDDSLTSGVTRIADPWGEVSNDCEQFPFGALNIPQRSAACDPLIGTLSTLDDEYSQIRTELLAGPLSAERVDEQLAAWTAQIESSVAEASETYDDARSVDEWLASVDILNGSLVDARLSDGR